MDKKKLLEERAKLYEEQKALLDKAQADGNRTLSGEEQADFDRRDARMAEIKSTVDRVVKMEVEELQREQEREASEKRERDLATTRGRKTGDVIVSLTAEVEARLAFRAWANPDGATEAELSAAERLNFNHRRPKMDLRALSSITATQGQASIPDELMRAFVEIQKWYGRVRNSATVYNTSTGAPLPIPTVDDTANTGEIVADGGAITTTGDPLFGVVNLGAFKYSSRAVIVPWELLQDSSINLPVYLGTALGTRIARKQNTDFTVGAGTTLPFGIVTQASLGKTAAATNLITWDEIIDLFHSVDVAYRNRPSSAFMMHDTVAAFLRKLKDSQNRYLWEMSLQVGQPDRAFGQPVIINNDMSATFLTANRLVIYGDIAAYNIRDAGAVEVMRADELRMLNGQVVFLAIQRSDGNLVDTTAVRYLRTA